MTVSRQQLEELNKDLLGAAVLEPIKDVLAAAKVQRNNVDDNGKPQCPRRHAATATATSKRMDDVLESQCCKVRAGGNE